MGLFDQMTQGLFGGGDPGSSGSFPGNREVGEALQRLLLERLNTPPSETEAYRLGSQAIRDAMTMETNTARQRYGDMATTGGFADSGALLSGLMGIDRAGAAAQAGELRNLLLGLESRRLEGVLPFLSGASEEHLGRAGIAEEHAQFTEDFLYRLGQMIASKGMSGSQPRNSSGPGTGAMGGSMGGGAPGGSGMGPGGFGGFGGCWVAAAAYDGWDDPRTHEARRWLLLKAPAWFRKAYLKHGPKVAKVVAKSRFLRAVVRRFFDRVRKQ